LLQQLSFWLQGFMSLSDEEHQERVANKITAAKVAGACGFMRLILSRLSSSRSGAYRHFAEFYRSA
jgi:hypothetical protein